MIVKNSLMMLGILLLPVALWGLGLRPWRRPSLIFAPHNRKMRKLFFAIVLLSDGPLVWGYISAIPLRTYLHKYGYQGMAISALLGLVLFIWAMLSIFVFPYQRAPRVPGGAAFARRYARYQEDGELERLQFGWVPDLVVDGVRYNVVGYEGKDTQDDDLLYPMLAFDKQGRVVRDRETMDKLARCIFLAQGVVLGRGHTAERMEGYHTVRRLVKQLEQGLAQFDDLVAPLKALADANEPQPTLTEADYKTRPVPERILENIERARRGLEINLEFSRLVLQDWETEARWEREKGYDRIKEIRYEELLQLAGQLKAIEYARDHAEVLKQCWLAYRYLLNPIRKRYTGSKAQQKQLLDLLHVLEVAKHALDEDIKNWPQKGPIIKYRAMKEEEVARWQARLAWYDRVEGWRAEGYEGLALEPKKLQWQIENEGLQLTAEGRRKLKKKGVLP